LRYLFRVDLADVPLETRLEAFLAVLQSEPRMSVWKRAELLQAALWP
jgi:hypothetical protein